MVQSIGQNGGVLGAAAQLTSLSAGQSMTSDGKLDFSKVIGEAIKKVSDAQKSAEAVSNDFSTEKQSVQLHDVMIEMQKANIMFQEMVQVRNKVVSAYQEIMNMQV